MAHKSGTLMLLKGEEVLLLRQKMLLLGEKMLLLGLAMLLNLGISKGLRVHPVDVGMGTIEVRPQPRLTGRSEHQLSVHDTGLLKIHSSGKNVAGEEKTEGGDSEMIITSRHKHCAHPSSVSPTSFFLQIIYFCNGFVAFFLVGLLACLGFFGFDSGGRRHADWCGLSCSE